MSQPAGPDLPEWIAATVALAVAIAAALKQFFGLVTRKELQDTLLTMHRENMEGREKLSGEMKRLAEKLANLGGRFDQSQGRVRRDDDAG